MQYPPKIKSGIVRKNSTVRMFESQWRAPWLDTSQLAAVNAAPNSAEKIPPASPATAPKTGAVARRRRIVGHGVASVRETRGVVRDGFTSSLSDRLCPYGKLDI